MHPYCCTTVYALCVALLERQAKSKDANWYPVLQVFILIPNTIPNLGTYVSWYVRARQAGVFLPQHTSGAGGVAVEAGATLFIPGELRRLAGLP